MLLQLVADKQSALDDLYLAGKLDFEVWREITCLLKSAECLVLGVESDNPMYDPILIKLDEVLNIIDRGMHE